MLNLTFGEQVKIILSRKGMTIKQLAEIIEERTGKKMSRQNLTQRLGRDNFQEQDMRVIADILGCPFQLSILADSEVVGRASAIQDVEPTEKELSKIARAKEKKEERKENKEVREEAPQLQSIEPESKAEEPEKLEEAPDIEKPEAEPDIGEPEAELEQDGAARDITIGELVDIHEELDHMIETETAEKAKGWRSYFQRKNRKDENSEAVIKPGIQEIYAEDAEEPVVTEEDYNNFENSDEAWTEDADTDNAVASEVIEEEIISEEYAEEYTEEYVSEADEIDDEDLELGDINQQTGHEYETNSVRIHPKRIGYVQVYDRSDHRWTDMTEWAFLGYQERKKALLGKDYEPPIYLD